VLEQLGPVLKDGALVIVESTVAPGTMGRVVRPLLEKSSGKRVNGGFTLGHCPERVMPGKLLANLRGVSRVCGGATPETAQAMVALYRHVVEADLDPADCLTAELVKTVENAYRDVNIAFANEVALGGDVWKVRELVNKSPGRNMLLPEGHIHYSPFTIRHSPDPGGAGGERRDAAAYGGFDGRGAAGGWGRYCRGQGGGAGLRLSGELG
jgi:nucleotide sugar dehydrogenase